MTGLSNTERLTVDIEGGKGEEKIPVDVNLAQGPESRLRLLEFLDNSIHQSQTMALLHGSDQIRRTILTSSL